MAKRKSNPSEILRAGTSLKDDEQMRALHELVISGAKGMLVPHVDIEENRKSHSVKLDGDISVKRIELMALKKDLYEHREEMNSLKKQVSKQPARRKAAPDKAITALKSEIKKQEKKLKEQEEQLKARELELKKRENEFDKLPTKLPKLSFSKLLNTEKKLAKQVDDFTKKCGELELLIDMRQKELKKLNTEHNSISKNRDAAAKQWSLFEKQSLVGKSELDEIHQELAERKKELASLRNRSKGQLSNLDKDITTRKEALEGLQKEEKRLLHANKQLESADELFKEHLERDRLLREQNDAVAAELETLKREQKRLKESCISLGKKRENLDERLNERQGAYAEALNALKTFKHTSEKQSTKLRVEVTTLVNERTSLRHKNSQIHKGIAALEEQRQNLQAETDVLEVRQDKLASTVREMETHLADILHEHEGARHALDSTKKELTSLERLRDEGTHSIKHLDQKVTRLETALESKTEALRDVEERIDIASRDFRTKEKELELKDRELERVEKQLDEESKRIETRRSEILGRETSLRTEMKDAASSVKAAKEKLTSLEELDFTLNKDLTAKKTSLLKAEKRLAVLTNEVRTLAEERTRLDRETKDGTAELNRLEKEFRKRNSHYEKILADAEEKQKFLSEAKEKRDALMSGLSEAKAEFEETETALAERKDQLLHTNAEMKVQEMAYTRLKEENDDVTAALVRLRGEKQKLQSEVQSLDKERNRITAEYASIAGHVSATQEELDDKKNALKDVDALLESELKEINAKEQALKKEERKLETRLRLVVDTLLDDFKRCVQCHDTEGMHRAYNQLSSLYTEFSGELRKYTYTRLLEVQRMIS